MLHRQRRMAGFGALVFLLHASAYVPLHPPARPGLRLFAPARSGPQMCDSLDLPPDARGTGGRTRRKRAKALAVAKQDAALQREAAPGRNGAEAPIAWYLRTIADHELLTADEEIELSLLVQRMLAIRGKGEELAEDLGRPATQDELAAALSLGPAELKLHVQRGAAAG